MYMFMYDASPSEVLNISYFMYVTCSYFKSVFP